MTDSYQAEDTQVCAESTCRKCGHKGLEYQPFRDPDGGYRPLVRCPKCGYMEEF